MKLYLVSCSVEGQLPFTLISNSEDLQSKLSRFFDTSEKQFIELLETESLLIENDNLKAVLSLDSTDIE